MCTCAMCERQNQGWFMNFLLKMKLFNLYAGKTHNRRFLEVFRGGLDFFDPKIAIRCAQSNLGVKKVLAPRKTREIADYGMFCARIKYSTV